MQEEILAGFKEIATSMGYDPQEVYFKDGKLILPEKIKEEVLKEIHHFNQHKEQFLASPR